MSAKRAMAQERACACRAAVDEAAQTAEAEYGGRLAERRQRRRRRVIRSQALLRFVMLRYARLPAPTMLLPRCRGFDARVAAVQRATARRRCGSWRASHTLFRQCF